MVTTFSSNGISLIATPGTGIESYGALEMKPDEDMTELMKENIANDEIMAPGKFKGEEI
jgi:hypothetical protein